MRMRCARAGQIEACLYDVECFDHLRRNDAWNAPRDPDDHRNVCEAILEAARPFLDQAVVAGVVTMIRERDERRVLVPAGALHRLQQLPQEPIRVADLAVIDRPHLTEIRIREPIEAVGLPDSAVKVRTPLSARRDQGW